MNIALLSLVVVLAQTAAALPGGLDGQKQNRIAELNLPEFDRTSVSFVECSKKTEKVVLGYGELAMFESPNYPENYPSKTTCNWLFKSEEDITIALASMYFPSTLVMATWYFLCDGSHWSISRPC